MSSLGIRFALPFKGSNGIEIKNNVIKINPFSSIEFYDTENPLFRTRYSSINARGIIVQTLDQGTISTQLSVTSDQLEVVNVDPSYLAIFSGSGFVLYSNNILLSSLQETLQTKSIKTTLNNPSAPEIVFNSISETAPFFPTYSDFKLRTSASFERASS